jgi:hypothetical protein
VTARLLVVATVLVMVVVVARVYRRHRARAASGVATAGPLTVPARLAGSSDRTWVVFTSPYCASCGPLVDLLRRSDPGAAVVTVDAGRDPSLTREFGVLSAPTTILAGADGRVIERFVGSRAVHRFLHDTLGLNPAA